MLIIISKEHEKAVGPAPDFHRSCRIIFLLEFKSESNIVHIVSARTFVHYLYYLLRNWLVSLRLAVWPKSVKRTSYVMSYFYLFLSIISLLFLSKWADYFSPSEVVGLNY